MIGYHKKFKELKDGDFIYYLNPFIGVNERAVPLDLLVLPTIGGQDQFIQPVKIKTIKGIEDEPNYRDWVDIEYFRPEPIVHSKDINMIPTVTLRFNGNRNFSITMVKLEGYANDFPVPYCTSKEFLTDYVRSTR